MRIVIETDEQSGAGSSGSMVRAGGGDSASFAPAALDATDAGPPSQQLLQAISEASAPSLARNVGREAIDGGGPALELVQDLRQSAAEPSSRSSESPENGGGAPL
ncbi:hypothetical protein [Duganella sp. Root336D2]|uniref:hypothetical protein n=1 Tax=Duganella sp. Root336D2 TaxID=1736518 RepID=UPI0006FACC41|nr:hypothetical protein [Duganella sp. Root336D2]KQV61506.1 hypothetical protein ASD07_01235 [Duganella sp. Root336D2]